MIKDSYQSLSFYTNTLIVKIAQEPQFFSDSKIYVWGNLIKNKKETEI